MDLRESAYIVENIAECIFGFHRTLNAVREQEIAKGETTKEESNLLDENMNTVNSYNLVKNAIWNCVLEDESIPLNKQKVNLNMLRDILLELNTMIQLVRLNSRYQIRLSEEGRKAQIVSSATYTVNMTHHANKMIGDVLKRFSVLDPL